MQFIYQVNINKGSNLNCIEIVILVSNFQLVLNFANIYYSNKIIQHKNMSQFVIIIFINIIYISKIFKCCI